MVRTSSATRSRILDEGVDLLSRVGLGQVTIGRLADRLGMSKSGLFAHFRSKGAVEVALLERAVAIADEHVVAPSMTAPPGLMRLTALISNWLGWTRRAGLKGGCPMAAGLFELDDVAGETRDALSAIELRWRSLLSEQVVAAVERGELDRSLDVEQFVWELCGIYLSHHASLRFLNDGAADTRAWIALDALFARAGARELGT